MDDLGKVEQLIEMFGGKGKAILHCMEVIKITSKLRVQRHYLKLIKEIDGYNG